MDGSMNARSTELADGRHRLLGGWRDIVDDIRMLEHACREASTACECGDGPARPGGTCVCCRPSRESTTDCVDCLVRVHTVSWRVDQLVNDALHFFPIVVHLVRRQLPENQWSHADEVRRRIVAVMTLMRRLESASGEFSRGCRTSHLGVLKDPARELLAAAQVLDDLIEPSRNGREERRYR